MNRVRLWTAPERPIGEMVAEELRKQGLPVTVEPSGTGEMYPNPLTEVWLEDESLLQDPDVQRMVDEVIAGAPLKAEDEEKIAAMPFQDAPEKPLIRPGRAAVVVQWVLLLLIALAAGWAAYKLASGR